ncbi:hypothetical protein JCM10207_000237 [Rhodosporidiobolus poonsookiae]
MADKPIDILIVGFGAVGTLYGWVLSQNSNVRVTAIARSSYEDMKNGITLSSEKFGDVEGWKPFRLVKDPAEANDRAYKYIICSTKVIPDLMPTASVLAPFLESPHNTDTVDLEDGPTVVLIQNGIGIEHPLATAYPEVPIISVVAWVGANLHAGGRVTHGLLEKLVGGVYTGEGGETGADSTEHVEDEFADPHGYRKQPDGPDRLDEAKRRAKVFADLVNNGGGCFELVDSIQPRRYEKNLWNAAWSSLCTISRCTVSQAVAPSVLPYTLPVARRTMLEVLYVARAWGYAEDVLPLKLVDDVLKITIKNYQRVPAGVPQTPGTPGIRGDGFGSLGGYGWPTEGETAKESLESTVNFKPSMLLDVEAGRPCELEPIIGSLLDRARARGVATPRLDMAYAALKIHQDQAIQAHAASQQYQQHIQSWLSKPPSVAGLGAAGRQAWEKAVRKAQLPEHEKGSVGMANGKDKIPGKPVRSISGLGTDEE